MWSTLVLTLLAAPHVQLEACPDAWLNEKQVAARLGLEAGLPDERVEVRCLGGLEVKLHRAGASTTVTLTGATAEQRERTLALFIATWLETPIAKPGADEASLINAGTRATVRSRQRDAGTPGPMVGASSARSGSSGADASEEGGTAGSDNRDSVRTGGQTPRAETGSAALLDGKTAGRDSPRTEAQASGTDGSDSAGADGQTPDSETSSFARSNEQTPGAGTANSARAEGERSRSGTSDSARSDEQTPGAAPASAARTEGERSRTSTSTRSDEQTSGSAPANSARAEGERSRSGTSDSARSDEQTSGSAPVNSARAEGERSRPGTNNSARTDEQTAGSAPPSAARTEAQTTRSGTGDPDEQTPGSATASAGARSRSGTSTSAGGGRPDAPPSTPGARLPATEPELIIEPPAKPPPLPPLIAVEPPSLAPPQATPADSPIPPPVETLVPLELGLVPRVGLNRLFPSPTRNHVALGLLGVSSDALDGLSLAPLTLVDGAMHGVQLGLVSASGGVQGLQLGTLFATSAADTDGAQVSISLSITRAHLTGFQFGMVDVAGTVSGMQLGILNVGEDVTGLQLGLVNFARTVKGTQVGLINFSKHADAPVGGFNVTEDAPLRLSLFTADTSALGVSLETGGTWLYGIVSLGWLPPKVFRAGGGLGLHFGAVRGVGWFFEVEATAHGVVDADRPSFTLFGAYTLGFQAGYRFFPRLGLVAGPQLTLLTGTSSTGSWFVVPLREGRFGLAPGFTVGIEL